jgi:hypothetical protein
MNNVESCCCAAEDTAKYALACEFVISPGAVVPGNSRMLVVQPRGRNSRDEKLASIGARTGIRHAECVGSMHSRLSSAAPSSP